MKRKAQNDGIGLMPWLLGAGLIAACCLLLWSQSQVRDAAANPTTVNPPQTATKPLKGRPPSKTAPGSPAPDSMPDGAVPAIAPPDTLPPQDEAPPFDALAGRSLLFQLGRLDGLVDAGAENSALLLELAKAEDFPQRLRAGQKIQLPLGAWQPGKDLVLHARFQREGGDDALAPWTDKVKTGEFLTVELGRSLLYSRWQRSSRCDLEIWIPAALRASQGESLLISNKGSKSLELDALWVETQLPDESFRLAFENGAWLSRLLPQGATALDLSECGDPLPLPRQAYGQKPEDWVTSCGTLDNHWSQLLHESALARSKGWISLLVDHDGRWKGSFALASKPVVDYIALSQESQEPKVSGASFGRLSPDIRFEDRWQSQIDAARKTKCTLAPLLHQPDLFPSGLQAQVLKSQMNLFMESLTFAAGHGGSFAVLAGCGPRPGAFFPGEAECPVPQWALIETLARLLPPGCQRIPCNAVPTDAYRYGFLNTCWAAFRRPDAGITLLAASSAEPFRNAEITLPAPPGDWSMRCLRLDSDGNLISSDSKLNADELGLSCRLPLSGGFILADLTPAGAAKTKKSFAVKLPEFRRQVAIAPRFEASPEPPLWTLAREINAIANSPVIDITYGCELTSDKGKPLPKMLGNQIHFPAELPGYAAAWLYTDMHPMLLDKITAIELEFRVEGQGSRNLEFWSGTEKVTVSSWAGKWQRLRFPPSFGKAGVIGIRQADGKPMDLMLAHLFAVYNESAAKKDGLATQTKFIKDGQRIWLLANAEKVLLRQRLPGFLEKNRELTGADETRGDNVNWEPYIGVITIDATAIPSATKILTLSETLKNALLGNQYEFVLELKAQSPREP